MVIIFSKSVCLQFVIFTLVLLTLINFSRDIYFWVVRTLGFKKTSFLKFKPVFNNLKHYSGVKMTLDLFWYQFKPLVSVCFYFFMTLSKRSLSTFRLFYRFFDTYLEFISFSKYIWELSFELFVYNLWNWYLIINRGFLKFWSNFQFQITWIQSVHWSVFMILITACEIDKDIKFDGLNR